MSGYTKVYNSWFDLGLSMDALGIFVYMNSKHKDWLFRAAEIRKTLGLSDHKWRSATKELKQLGLYITTKTSKGTTISVGKLEESTTGRIPTSGSATSGSATRGIPTPLIRIDSSKTDSNKTDSNITSFDDFWSAYPKKKERKKCAAIWERRELDDIGEMIVADVEARLLNDGKWIEEDGKFVPNPQTYLNGDRWEDDMQPIKLSQAPQGKYQLKRKFLGTTEDNVIEGVVVDRTIGGAT
jgi:hypothetical protein